MSSYHEYGVGLSDGQKKKLARSFQKRAPVTLRLAHSRLSGSDKLMLTQTQISRLEKSKRNGTGVDIKISLTQMRKQDGGNLFSALMPMLRTALPAIAKTVGLSGLSGLVSGGIEKAIKGSGLFSVPQDKVDKLIRYKDYLTAAQKKQIEQAMQTGSGISRFRLSRKQQQGGFLGTLLASIGVPLLLKALTRGRGGAASARAFGPAGGAKGVTGKGVTGKGLQVEPPHWAGRGLHVEPSLPFNTMDVFVPPRTGRGVRGRKKRSKRGKGLLLGPNSPFQNVPLLGAIL